MEFLNPKRIVEGTVVGLSTAALAAGQILNPDVAINKNTQTDDCYTFREIWGEYLDEQVEPGNPVGKVVDFSDYCTPNGRGCGYNFDDQGFDKEFHGNVEGFEAIQGPDGIWTYCRE